MTLSKDQYKIVEWLFHYPAVHLRWYGPLWNHVRWSVSWADQEARRRLVEICTDPGIEREQLEAEIAPRGEHLDGPTPRCRFGTFQALLRRGLVENKGHDSYGPWQLSDKGKQAYLEAKRALTNAGE